MRRTTAILILALALAGCDIDGLAITQYHDDKYGDDWEEHCGEVYGCVVVPLMEGGELVEREVCKTVPPCPVQDLMVEQKPPAVETTDSDGDWPAPFVGALGPVHWGTGDLGGATATFVGTGGAVCAITDPQTVFRDDWVMTDSGVSSDTAMDDYIHDDGDLDLLVGMSADYTGTHGEIIGSFKRTFTDPLGVEREADFNLCLQYDEDGIAGGTAGKATPEWCTIDTIEGVEYTVVLMTFSVPMDDNALRFALQLREGACPAEVDECTLVGDADPSPITLQVGNLQYHYDDLEERYCEARHL